MADQWPRLRARSIPRCLPWIDLIFHGDKGQFEHDFVVAPGANLKVIKLNVENAEEMKIDGLGGLVVRLPGGEVRVGKPHAYQESGAERTDLAANFVWEEKMRVAFAVSGYDEKKPLIIDPTLSYSRYLGGSSDDIGNAIALDASGKVLIAGETGSSDFPVSGTAYTTSMQGGSEDAFAASWIQRNLARPRLFMPHPWAAMGQIKPLASPWINLWGTLTSLV